MNYDEMINGLADEMLEKIAADEDDYGYEDGYYGEDGYDYEDEYDEDDYITEDELDAMSDEELEALASAIYENELEKTAGAKWDAVKAVPGRVGGAIKNYGKNMVGYDAIKNQKKIRAIKKHSGEGDYKQLRSYKKRVASRNAGLKATGKAWAGTAAGAAAVGGGAYGVNRLKNKGQEKAAAMYEEAQLYKQAAEETWQEAQMIQDAASMVFDYFEE